SQQHTPPTPHHPQKTMACSLIPSEIRLRIFEFCPDVPTAASLAQISKPFNDTWMSYKKPICLDILERSVECYEDARNLVTLDLLGGSLTKEVLENSFESFTTCILYNAKKLKLAYDTIVFDPSYLGLIYPEGVPNFQVVDGKVCLSSDERRRLVSIWYKIQTVGSKLPELYQDRDLATLLDSVSNLEFFRMLEVARTLYPFDDETLDFEVKQVLPQDKFSCPSELAWEAATHYLQEVAIVRRNELDIIHTPGQDWQLGVILDLYAPMMFRDPENNV
ncbi:MAG: hypothetical protein Q9180_005280, partial [Flavoplaca navasiana]